MVLVRLDMHERREAGPLLYTSDETEEGSGREEEEERDAVDAVEGGIGDDGGGS